MLFEKQARQFATGDRSLSLPSLESRVLPSGDGPERGARSRSYFVRRDRAMPTEGNKALGSSWTDVSRPQDLGLRARGLDTKAKPPDSRHPRSLGEHAIEIFFRQCEFEEILLPYFAAAIGACHCCKMHGAFQTDRDVTLFGKNFEVAPWSRLKNLK